MLCDRSGIVSDAGTSKSRGQHRNRPSVKHRQSSDFVAARRTGGSVCRARRDREARPSADGLLGAEQRSDGRRPEGCAIAGVAGSVGSPLRCRNDRHAPPAGAAGVHVGSPVLVYVRVPAPTSRKLRAFPTFSRYRILVPYTVIEVSGTVKLVPSRNW